MSTKTIVAGTEVSLVDLSNDEDHPAHITLEIKKPKPEIVDLSDTLIQEVRQDPWELTDSYTLAEFKSVALSWKMAELEQVKSKLSNKEDQ